MALDNDWTLGENGAWEFTNPELGTGVTVSLVELPTIARISYSIQVKVETMEMSQHRVKAVTVEDSVGSLEEIMPKIDELVSNAHGIARKNVNLQRDLGTHLNTEFDVRRLGGQ